MIAIDSPSNPRIQAAVRLRERRERLATGLTLVDGAREARRALEAGVEVDAAYVCRSLVRLEDAVAAVAELERRHLPMVDVSERAFERVAFGDRHDGIVLVVRPPSTSLADLALSTEPLVLVTEDVEKPGNLGAILRTADGAGCDAVIAVGGTDLFNPNVIRASIGTTFTVRLAAGTPDEVRARLRERGLRIVTTRVDAERAYTDADLTGPLAIVLGAETTGLSEAWSGPGIEAVSIPMRGVADSLNVSASAAILAFEARRQRDAAAVATR